MVLTGGVAALDEFHQSLLPSRRGTVNDVLLDSAAAAAVQFLILAHCKFRRTAVISGAHADGIEDRG